MTPRLAALALWAAPLFCQTPAAPSYLDFTALERRIQDLARQNASIATLDIMGRSAAGRPIYALRIAAAGSVDPDKRQAAFIGANIAGYHNAGSQAALQLAERLLSAQPELLASRTFYIAPALNPDAHDGMFSKPRARRSTNGAKIDRDRDGLDAEDPPNDLNGDGRITSMRIADPAGDMIPDPQDPRRMIRADAIKGQRGAWRVVSEGADDDRDGQYNEDGPGGYRPDKNFAHGFAGNDPESGPWPSAVPETKAVMDYLLARRNVAIAFVFGPANNLLQLPRGAAPAAADGQRRVTVPRQMAAMLGLETDRQYTLDEVWEVAKDQPFAQNTTRDRLAEMLGGGAANRPDDEDLKYFGKLAEDYRKILEKAGLDARRPGRQSQAGGLANWLYYHYGVMTVEVDVWGVSRKPAPAPGKSEAQAPSAAAQPGPAPAAAPSGRPGASPAAGAPPASVETADILAYAEKEDPSAIVAWTQVTLPDGTKAEVGGVDPFVDIAPPEKVLNQAAQAHSDAILQFAGQLARLEVAAAEAKDLGENVWRVTATARNSGALPTHSKLGERTRNYLPVRLEVQLPQGASLVGGVGWVAAERLDAAGVLKGEWLVRGRKGARLTLTVTSQNAGTGRRELVLGGGR